MTNKAMTRAARRQQLCVWMLATGMMLNLFLAAGMRQAFAADDATGLAAQGVTLQNPRIVKNNKMKSGQVVTWDCIWFGSYPQTEVPESEALLAAQWDENGYAEVGGGRYRRITREDTRSKGGDSSEIHLGYPLPLPAWTWPDGAGTYRYFRYEPIKWRVLSAWPEGNIAFCVADKAIDAMPFDIVAYYGPNDEGHIVLPTWDNSTMRSWLNGYSANGNLMGADFSSDNFIDSAFNASEKQSINSSALDNRWTSPKEYLYHDNKGNPVYGPKVIDDVSTQDRIFLLSANEVFRDLNSSRATAYGFVASSTTEDEARRCRPSDFARAMGAGVYGDEEESYPYSHAYEGADDDTPDPKLYGYTRWLLRTSADGGPAGTFYSAVGTVHLTGTTSSYSPRDTFLNQPALCDYAIYGTRPAVKLKLNAPDIQYAGTTTSDDKTNEEPYVTDLSEAKVFVEETLTYNTKEHKPVPKVMLYNGELEYGVDFDVVSYESNILPGTATVTIAGKGKYKGSASGSFTIEKAPITSVVPEPDSFTYDRQAKKPSTTVYAGELELVEGSDYERRYDNNINAGNEATVIVTAKESSYFTGSMTANFTIKPATISAMWLTEDSFVYTGQEIKPALNVQVRDKEYFWVPADGYDVVYENNINVGTTDNPTATVTITGKGNFIGSKSATFTITPATITSVGTNPESLTYDGKEKKPELIVRAGEIEVPADGYDAVFENNIDAGTPDKPHATVKVTGKGNFTGDAEGTFTITPATIIKLELSQDSFTYNGQAHKPELRVFAGELELAAEDYDVTYENNIDAGTEDKPKATVTVSGKGNFAGSQSASFTINPASITSLTLDKDSFTYEAKEIQPTLIVHAGELELSAGDYDVVYENNINAGTAENPYATVTITGKGNFTGSQRVAFTIVPARIKKIAPMATNIVYDGTEKTPGFIVGTENNLLVPEDGYDVVYENNINARTNDNPHASATITGKGNFSGEKIVRFTIKPATIDRVELSQLAFAFDGEEKKPDVTVFAGSIELQDTDYDVAYAYNVNIGYARVTVTGKNNFAGTVVKWFNITGTEEPCFTDVVPEDEYHAVVHLSKDLGLIAGYPADKTFRPKKNISRAEVVTILWRMAGRPKITGSKRFKDVKKSKHYYYDAANWAYNNGVANGYGSTGKFQGNKPITREEFATMMANYSYKIAKKRSWANPSSYKEMLDKGDVTDYATQTIGWCYKEGLMLGTKENKILPQGYTVRKDAAAMLYKFYQYLNK